MKWRQLVNNAWGALFRHKLRSLLSTLGIVFAVVAVVSMLSIAEGAKHETLEQIEQLGANSIIVRRALLTEAQEARARQRLSRGLDMRDAASLERAIPALSYAAPLKEVRADILASDEKNPFEILAVTETYHLAKDLSLREGRYICPADITRRNLVCVLGAKVSESLGDNGRVGGFLRLNNRPYRIIGLLEERRKTRAITPALSSRDYNRAVFIPFGTQPTLSLSEREFGELSEISLKLARDANVVASAKAVRRILARNHGEVEDFQIIVPQELLHQEQRTQRVFNIVLGCIAGISLLVGGIGIMNMMLANVTERTREIGIRRAIGATRSHIVAQFLCESVLLTLAGGCAGLILGIGAAAVIGKVAGWRTVLTMWSMVLAIGTAVAVGILSGLHPAVNAARLDPVAALRQEL